MSKRVYQLLGFENGHVINMMFGVEDLIFEQETEVMITLRENIDSILDLKIDETISIQIIRDNEFSKGVILRKK
jgi:hypothetical protein